MLSKNRITGLLEGNLKVDAKGRNTQADSDLILTDISVALANPLLGIETINFDKIEADLTNTVRRIEIKACTMKGQDLDGEFTGNILVRRPFEKSILNLNGFLNPQAAFIKKAGSDLPLDMLMKNAPGEKGFFTGSMRQIIVSLRNYS